MWGKRREREREAGKHSAGEQSGEDEKIAHPKVGVSASVAAKVINRFVRVAFSIKHARTLSSAC